MCDDGKQPVVYCILSHTCNSITNGLFSISVTVAPVLLSLSIPTGIDTRGYGSGPCPLLP